jgi:outer membrane protein TolC
MCAIGSTLAPRVQAEAPAPPATVAHSANPFPADPLLRRLIEQSVNARPELAQAEASLRAEQARVPQEGAWPDPMLQVGIQNDGFTSIEVGRMETSFVSFMASQTFPWPGKPALRRSVAELGASQSGELLARVRMSTEAEVARAYVDLLLARDRMRLLDRLDELWRSSLGAAQTRYEAGGGAQSDILRAQLEINRNKQRRLSLHGEELARLEAINRLRAHPLDEPIETSSRVRDLTPLPEIDRKLTVDRMLAQSPELAAARRGIDRAAKSVALAEKGYYPDLTVSAGVMVRGPLPPMWLLTVGGPVPVFAGSKQNRAVDEQRDRQLAAEKQVQAVEQVLRLRAEERRTALTALLDIQAIYEKGLLVQSEASADSTLAQYKVGKVTFASVLESNAGLIADEESYLESLAAAHRIRIADAEISLEPTAMPGASASSAGMPGAGPSSMGSAASAGTKMAAPSSTATPNAPTSSGM